MSKKNMKKLNLKLKNFHFVDDKMNEANLLREHKINGKSTNNHL